MSLFWYFFQFFAVDNNLYYQSDLTSDPVALTTDGQHNVVYNGVPDWLYEGKA